jgi:hypothetical protein
MPVLIVLLAALNETLFPTGDRDRALARAAACFINKGMDEAQVYQVLGGTIYTLRQSSLGGYAVWPEYHLMVAFDYRDGTRVTSTQFVRIEPLPGGERRLRYLQRLLLR